MAPVPTTNTLPAIDAQKEGDVHVLEQSFIIPSNSVCSLKNSIINATSTNNIDPTKRLDTVDDATGRIVYKLQILHLLEINKTTSIKDTIKIGHFEHTRQFNTNDSRASVHFRTSCKVHSQ